MRACPKGVHRGSVARNDPGVCPEQTNEKSRRRRAQFLASPTEFEFLLSAATNYAEPRLATCRRYLAAGAREMSLPSFIDRTWVTLEFGNHQYDHIHGYDHVMNIATEVVLGSSEPGYDPEKFSALMEEIKPYLRRYDKVNVVSKRTVETANGRVRQTNAAERHVERLAFKAKQFV
jgi:hypothetical protein